MIIRTTSAIQPQHEQDTHARLPPDAKGCKQVMASQIIGLRDALLGLRRAANIVSSTARLY